MEYADRLHPPLGIAHRRMAVAPQVGCNMRRLLRVAMICVWIYASAVQARAATYYVIVAGLGGEPDYEQRFTAAAKDLDKIFTASGESAHRLYVDWCAGYRIPAIRLRSMQWRATPKRMMISALILIGHGSFDGVNYKFNLVGPDVTASEIAAMCDRCVPARRQLVVDTNLAPAVELCRL